METTATCDFATFNWSTPHSVIIELNSIDPSSEQIKEFGALLDATLARLEQPFISMVDATHAKWISSTARIELGKLSKVQEEKYAGVELLTVMVMPNAIVNMMLKGFNLVNKPITPQVIVKSREKGDVLMAEELAKITSA